MEIILCVGISIVTSTVVTKILATHYFEIVVKVYICAGAKSRKRKGFNPFYNLIKILKLRHR